MSRCLKLCGGACAGVMCITSHALAAIVCEDNFQIVHGVAISTPFCQDENLAAHARKLGRQISGADLRSHLEAKRDACALGAPGNETACANYSD